ncbi:MAG: MGMT family protein [Candidatus Pacebacteria bacterium]|nr:MGMT family protein [Candidatus Paceibacterota bacterium]
MLTLKNQKNFKPKTQNKKILKHNHIDRIMQVVSGIPKGETLTYKEVGTIAGIPRGWRLVGRVMSQNQNYQQVPCHRVIKSSGKLSGYNRGINLKKELLKSEGVKIIGNRVKK